MVWPLAGANPSDGQKDIQDTDAAHRTAEGRMEYDGSEQRVVIQKKILLPIHGPRQIEQQRAHFEREHHQKCAINPVHRWMENRPACVQRGSADGLLKSRDALGYVAVVDVPRVDLRKTL